jgi:hypothetical protein
MNVTEISKYLKSQGFDPNAIEPIPPEPDLLPDILDKLIELNNTLRAITIPEPINFKPDINQSGKKIVDSIKSIRIPEYPILTPEFQSVVSAVSEIKTLLLDKSGLLNISNQLSEYTKDSNSIGFKIITQLESANSEIQSTNKVTSNSIDTLKQIISTLKSMDTSKILKEVVKAVNNQDETNKIIISGIDDIVSKVTEPRNYHFTDFERDDNGWLSGLKAYQIK